MSAPWINTPCATCHETGVGNSGPDFTACPDCGGWGSTETQRSIEAPKESWTVRDQLTGKETTFETWPEAYSYAVQLQGELHPKQRRWYIERSTQEF